MIRVLDLFSGIGGFSLGLERTGKFQTVAFCDISVFCRKVLRKHWPDVPTHDDIQTREFRGGEADLICGGFPCQDISRANAAWGERAGLAGARSGLWGQLLRAIRVVRPLRAVVENVAALLERGMGTVLGDLAEIGYDAEWHCIPASALGFIHDRDRVWIVADSGSERAPRLVAGPDFSSIGQGRTGGKTDLFAIANAPFEPGNRWPQPLIRRVDDGVSGRVDRLEAIGNAIVPDIPEFIGRALLEDKNG